MKRSHESQVWLGALAFSVFAGFLVAVETLVLLVLALLPVVAGCRLLGLL